MYQCFLQEAALCLRPQFVQSTLFVSKSMLVKFSANVLKQDALGNTDGNILFIIPDWYFGALIVSVVNAVAK